MKASQEQLFAPRVELNPWIVERRRIIEDETATLTHRLTALVQLVGYLSGPGGDPHLEGYRGVTLGTAMADALVALDLTITRAT